MGFDIDLLLLDIELFDHFGNEIHSLWGTRDGDGVDVLFGLNGDVCLCLLVETLHQAGQNFDRSRRFGIVQENDIAHHLFGAVLSVVVFDDPDGLVDVVGIGDDDDFVALAVGTERDREAECCIERFEDGIELFDRGERIGIVE